MFTGLFFPLALALAADDALAARPAELLQARSCRDNLAVQPMPNPANDLLDAETAPPCLKGIFKVLSAEALRLAGRDDATAVLFVGVGRAFNSATLLFSSDADAVIHYAQDLGPISETLSAEWSEYLSPDGELGWSGFVLVADHRRTRVRFLTSASSPFAAYESAVQLEAEFFPGKHPSE
jgi:hypothetical protein